MSVAKDSTAMRPLMMQLKISLFRHDDTVLDLEPDDWKGMKYGTDSEGMLPRDHQEEW
jgi:hypothetical protein